MSTGFGEPITPDPSQKQSRTPREPERSRRRMKKKKTEKTEKKGRRIHWEERINSGKGRGGGSDEGEILSRL